MLAERGALFRGVQRDLQNLFPFRSAGPLGLPHALHVPLQSRTESRGLQAADGLMPPSANLFQIVTFAADPLRGNPAFVLTGVGNASERQLTAACAMLRTDIIAVVG